MPFSATRRGRFAGRSRLRTKRGHARPGDGFSRIGTGWGRLFDVYRKDPVARVFLRCPQAGCFPLSWWEAYPFSRAEALHSVRCRVLSATNAVAICSRVSSTTLATIAAIDIATRETALLHNKVMDSHGESDDIDGTDAQTDASEVSHDQLARV